MAKCRKHEWQVLFPQSENGDRTALECGDGTYDYCTHCGAISWITRHASRNRATLKWPELHGPIMERARRWNASIGRTLPAAFERETALLLR